MKYKKTVLLSAMLALFAITGCDDDDNDNGMMSQSDKARVRVVHASFDAPDVDVVVDGKVAISALAYGESSGYAEIEAGTRNIKVTETGQTQPSVITADIPFEADKEYTVYAVNSLGSIETILTTDNRTVNANQARVRFIHGSPDAPPVDIKLVTGIGPAVFANTAFKGTKDYLEVDGGTYTFVVTGAGSTDEVVTIDPVTLENGKIYTVLAHGTLGNASFPFTVTVFIDNDAGNGSADLTFSETAEVRVVHASPDAPGVDLLIDNITINNLPVTFTEETGSLTLADGTRNFKINAASNGLNVITADVNLAADGNYTVFAANQLSSIEPLVLSDNLAAPAAGKAHVRFVHLSPDAPTVDITANNNAVTVFNDVAFKGYVDFTPLDAGTYNIEVRDQTGMTLILDLGSITFEEGKTYTVYARGLAAQLGASIITHN